MAPQGLTARHCKQHYRPIPAYADNTIEHTIDHPAPNLITDTAYAYNAIDHATEHSIPLLRKPAPPSTIQCQY